MKLKRSLRIQKLNKLRKIIKHYDKLSIRHTDNRDVCFYHVVSRHGNYILNETLANTLKFELNILKGTPVEFDNFKTEYQDIIDIYNNYLLL